MAVKKTYRINLRNYGSPPAVMVSQYDEGYAIAFEIFDGPLPVLASSLSGYTFKLKGRQPGNPPFLAYEFEGTLATALNAVVSFEIDTTMTGRAGKGTAELVILDEENDVKFASVNFAVYTEPAAVPDGSIDADVQRAMEIAEEVQEIVDTAAAEVKGEAEAWAVGQRDGEDVPSTDPTYENNAKYYAEQAQDIADSIGIDATLSVAGKAADAKKTGDEISELKEDLNAELSQIRSATSNLCNVSTGRFYIDASGNIGASPTENYVGMSEAIPANAEESYILSFFGLTVSTTSKMYWAFYASDGTLVGSRQSVNRAGTNVHYTVTVPEGASKLCACMYNSSGINADAGVMISQGSSNPTEYIPPYTGMDKVARAAVNALDGEMAIKRKGLLTQATVTAEGWTNLIDLPDEYAYAIGAGITINGKPSKFESASFTLFKLKVRNTVDYGVYLAIGRSAAYYAFVYTQDTTPNWIEIGTPVEKEEDDHTLGLRWGTTAQIVLLGDSIVQGVGSSDYSATGDTIVTIDGTEFKRNVGVKSWGAQFKAKIEEDYYGLTVVNNGLPGKGIHVITANLDSLVTSSTKYAIVCAGVNNRNSGATTIQDYYIALFEALQAKGINVLCLSPIDKNGATGNTSLAMINTACERACNACDVPYYNLYGEYNAVLNANTKADYYNDQLHPNDKGYATMFGIICKLLNL